MAWLWFIVVQLIQLACELVGLVVLIPVCLMHAWEPCVGDGSTKFIDRWKWAPLDLIYGNPEDGVSGAKALVWDNGQKVPYMPNAWAPWRAYCWSALRNSADNLKYVFAWDKGPLIKKDYKIFGRQRTFRAGWQMENGINVPVLSL